MVKDIRGNDVDLNIYKGKVLLIANLSFQCGLTNSNYNELNEVYTKYKGQGIIQTYIVLECVSSGLI